MRSWEDLLQEAAGGDFKTGALAAGINEALVDSLSQIYGEMDDANKESLLVMNSQVIGVLAAAAQGGDEKALQTGAPGGRDCYSTTSLSMKRLVS